MKKHLIAVAVMALFAGCQSTVPIHESEGVPIPSALNERDSKELAVEVVNDPIITGRGWYLTERHDDRVSLRLEIRTHVAEVDVYFEDNRLKPVLVSTENLHQTNGEIHPNFNVWIRNLESDMRRVLSRIAATEG